MTLAASTHAPITRTPPACDALLAAAEAALRSRDTATAITHLLSAAEAFRGHGMPERAREVRGAALRLHAARVAVARGGG